MYNESSTGALIDENNARYTIVILNDRESSTFPRRSNKQTAKNIC